MSKHKPQRGHCGVCGCAVVAPSDTDVIIAQSERALGGSWDKPIIESGWANGHEFDDAGKLVQVRCPKHGGKGFPPAPVTDATVQQ